MQQDKSNLYVEKGTPTHAFELAEKLRQQDIEECALAGNTPTQSLINPFRYQRDNVNTYTILKNDMQKSVIEMKLKQDRILIVIVLIFIAITLIAFSLI